MEEQPGSRRGTGDPLGATVAFDAALGRWRDAGRTDAAVGQRRRQGWLERQAGADTTLAGVLAGHAERGRRVALTTVDGSTRPGWVRAVGTDVVVLDTPATAVLLVALHAVVAVRAAEPDPAAGARRSATGGGPIGDEASVLDATLADLLAELAPDRPDLGLRLGAAGPRVSGELIGVGLDTVALRPTGDGATIHVALGAITECRLG